MGMNALIVGLLVLALGVHMGVIAGVNLSK